METTITILGWVLLGTIALAFAVFATAFLWGAAYLGYHLSTRIIRERRRWKKVIRTGNQSPAVQHEVHKGHKRRGKATQRHIGKPKYKQQK